MNGFVHIWLYVIIENQESTLNEISTGVSQGSLLGSSLFLIYINDLHKCIKYSNLPFCRYQHNAITFVTANLIKVYKQRLI